MSKLLTCRCIHISPDILALLEKNYGDVILMAISKLTPLIHCIHSSDTDEMCETPSILTEFMCYDVSLSLRLLKIIYDYSWERLHLGVWNLVPIVWRETFAYSCYLTACLCSESAMKHIDLGLMMGGTFYRDDLLYMSRHLFPIETTDLGICDMEDSVLHSISDELLINLLFGSESFRSRAKRILVLELPSLEDFMLNHLSRSRPVVIRGITDEWPARTSRPWKNPKYIYNVAGSRTVPVELGSCYISDDSALRLMTVKEFLEQYFFEDSEKSANAYLAQYQLFDHIPELRRDISIPDYCFVDNNCEDDSFDEVVINAWIGGVTVSPLHTDRYHNIFCQIYGSKYIRLYPPAAVNSMYAHKSSVLSNTSRILDILPSDGLSIVHKLAKGQILNIEHMKPRCVGSSSHEININYPLFADAEEFFECIVRPGDSLFIPRGWWHYVRSLERSISVSFWFGKSL